MSGHTMRVTMEPYGRIDLQPVCHAPSGAPCRVIYPEGCESWSEDDHALPTQDVGDPEKHRLEATEYCNVVEFLTNDDVAELYIGPGVVPVHDRMAIDVRWDLHGYVWSIK